jgi:hypothetical protein
MAHPGREWQLGEAGQVLAADRPELLPDSAGLYGDQPE